MAAKTSVSRYWTVRPQLPPSAYIRAQKPPVSLEPGRPTRHDRASGEVRSFPERLGSDVGLFLGRRSHPVGDMATPATVFFSCSLAGSPIPSSTPPRGTQKYPPLPLKGGGGISSLSDLGGIGLSSRRCVLRNCDEKAGESIPVVPEGGESGRIPVRKSRTPHCVAGSLIPHKSGVVKRRRRVGAGGAVNGTRAARVGPRCAGGRGSIRTTDRRTAARPA